MGVQRWCSQARRRGCVAGASAAAAAPGRGRLRVQRVGVSGGPRREPGRISGYRCMVPSPVVAKAAPASHASAASHQGSAARPPARGMRRAQHLRLPHPAQAPLHLLRRPPDKRHAHSGGALAPMLLRSPLWPLATLSCSAPRRCATRACWEWTRLETPESCPHGTKCLQTADSSAVSLVARFGVEPRGRTRRRSAGHMRNSSIGRSKRAASRNRKWRSI